MPRTTFRPKTPSTAPKESSDRSNMIGSATLLLNGLPHHQTSFEQRDVRPRIRCSVHAPNPTIHSIDDDFENATQLPDFYIKGLPRRSMGSRKQRLSPATFVSGYDYGMTTMAQSTSRW